MYYNFLYTNIGIKQKNLKPHIKLIIFSNRIIMQKEGQTQKSKTPQLSFKKFVLRSLKPYIASKTQLFWIFISLILFFSLVPLMQQGLNFKNYVQSSRVEYDWPKISDFYITLIIYLTLGRIRSIITLSFKPLMLRNINKKYQGQERIERAHKQAKHVYKFLYFLFIISFGYYAMKDHDYFPPSLLGKGDSKNTFKDFPYMKNLEMIKNYYLTSAAYHLDSFLALLTERPKKDFGEMFLHHLVTVALIFCSYITNFIPVGSLVMFIHDQADVPICFVRCIIDLKNLIVLKIIGYLFIMGIWLYTRLIVYPKDVIYYGLIVATQETQHMRVGINIFTILLLTLYILHIYWFGLLTKMGINLVVNKKTEDLQNDLSQNKSNQEFDQKQQ